MKAVIVEIQGRFAAALLENGCIEKVKNQHYAIGQVIEVNKSVCKKTGRIAALAASAAALFLVCGVSAWAYFTPYSYVSLDVNPSIEYSLNRFERILRVEGVNDDGKKLLQQIGLNNLGNKTIDEAISLTMEQLQKAGYLKGEADNAAMIAVCAKDIKKAEQLCLRLEEKAQDCVREDVEVQGIGIGLERVEEAKELGVTPGKLRLVEKLIASSPDPKSINQEEWLNKPVKEIMKAIAQNRSDAKKNGQDGLKQNGNGEQKKDQEQKQDHKPQTSQPQQQGQQNKNGESQNNQNNGKNNNNKDDNNENEKEVNKNQSSQGTGNSDKENKKG